MRLPTLAGLTAAVRAVFARFPETMLAGVASAVLAMLTAHGEGERVMAAWAGAGLALVLFFAAAIVSESLRPERIGRFDATRLGLDVLALAAAVAFALAWPGWSDTLRAHRLIQFVFAAQLFASFAPFLRRHDPNAFWQWNRTLFVRFVLGGIFSAVLFAGLAVALAAAKPLFGIRVPEKTFFDLWLAVAFVFQTGFFMAGIPRDHDALARDDDYPPVLKVFAQFLLVPLVALYLVILNAYLVKVLVTGQWPNGWIGWLVSSVSAAGLLALLLVHPVRDREENRWVATFSRWFFVALLPSLGMLFAAIGKRVGQYGFTEERYDLFALAAWMALIAIVYSIRRRTDIRWIPITLCAVAVLTSFGPWSTYSVSRADQTRRLVRTLEKIGVDTAGRLSGSRTLGFEERKKLSDLVRYVAGQHGLRSLPASLRAAAESDSVFRASDERSKRHGALVAQAVLRGLGQEYVDQWAAKPNGSFGFHGAFATGHVEDLEGFKRMLRIENFSSWRNSAPVTSFDGRTRTLRVTDGRGGAWAFALDSLITARLAHGLSSHTPPFPPPARFEASDRGVPARLLVRSLQGAQQGDTIVIHTLDGEVFLGRPR